MFTTFIVIINITMFTELIITGTVTGSTSQHCGEDETCVQGPWYILRPTQKLALLIN